jgi:hypothetical protein
MSSRILRARFRRDPASNPSLLMRSAFAVCCVMVEPPWIFFRST